MSNPKFSQADNMQQVEIERMKMHLALQAEEIDSLKSILVAQSDAIDALTERLDMAADVIKRLNKAPTRSRSAKATRYGPAGQFEKAKAWAVAKNGGIMPTVEEWKANQG